MARILIKTLLVVLFLIAPVWGQKVAIVSNNFNAGELSPLLDGRSDLPKYFAGCRTLANMVPLPHGPAVRRPGSIFVAEVKDSNNAIRLIPFKYSVVDTYILEFGNYYIRFYRNGGQILDTNSAPYEIASPYSKTDLPDIQFVQSADVMYLTHFDIRSKQLSRAGHTNWTIADFNFTGGPFQDENKTPVTITPPAIPTDVTGSQTYSASSQTAGNEASKAFDDVITGTNGWLTANGSVTNQWIRCQFSSAKTIKQIKIWIIQDTSYWTRTPQTLKIEASNNGTNWTKLSVVKWRGYCSGYNGDEVYVNPENVVFYGETCTITLDNQTAYTYYRLFIYNNYEATNYIGIKEIEMYEAGSDIFTASSSLWQAGHTGSLWKLTHPRSKNKVSGGMVSGWSDSLDIHGNWSLNTHGTWEAKLELQRSYDDGGTWEVFKTYSVASDAPPIDTGNEEDLNVLYRLYVSAYVSGTIKYCLSTEEGTKFGIILITEFIDTTHVKASIVTELANITATDRWAEGVWSNFRGWPSAIEFHEQRLVFGGSDYFPQGIWLSRSDDYSNFLAGDTAKDAIFYELTGQNPISWLSSHNYLVVGTFDGIGRLTGQTPDEPITADTVPNYKSQIRDGSMNIQPAFVGDAILFVDRGKRRIIAVAYDWTTDAYAGMNLSLLANHLLVSDVTGIAFQSRPYPVLWICQKDGDFISLSYDKQQQVVAWAKHSLGGQVESVAVIPASDEDQVWICVKRTINGIARRYIEYLAPYDWGNDDKDAFFVNCGLSFNGGNAVGITAITKANPGKITVSVWPTLGNGTNLADGDQVKIASVGGMTELNNNIYTINDPNVTAKTFKLRNSTDTADVNTINYGTYTLGGTVQRFENTFSGLSHLEGQAVAICADLAVYNGKVSSGIVSLPGSAWANTVHIGLPYTSTIQPMRLALPGEQVSIQHRIKRIVQTTLNFYKSLQAKVGPSASQLVEIPFIAGMPYTGDKEVPYAFGYSRYGDITIVQDKPLPMTLRSIISEVEIGD